MNCPIDGTALVMSDRQGIEIDYCPQCRGVWLDRGELDKIIERSIAQMGGQSAAPAQSAQAPVPPRPQVIVVDDDDYYKQHGHHKKKRGWLDDIFDF